MTKGDLVENVAKAGQLSKKAAGFAVDTTFETIGRSIKKEKRFQFPGFGTFTVRGRKAREGRNPQTGAVIHIKASRTVAFKRLLLLKKDCKRK
jgi:DNA-binding protein HU-beta